MKLKTEERLNTSIEDGVQTKTVDSTESTVFPVTPETAKKLAEELKIEVDGKYIKFDVNDVDLNAYGITAFESLIFVNVVTTHNNGSNFVGYFKTLVDLEKKGYIKCVDGCWLPAYTEKYDETTKIKAISLVLSRYKFLASKDVYERMLDFIFYHDDVIAQFDLCDGCPNAISNEQGFVLDCKIDCEPVYCRNRLLHLVKTGVIK